MGQSTAIRVARSPDLLESLGHTLPKPFEPTLKHLYGAKNLFSRLSHTSFASTKTRCWQAKFMKLQRQMQC
jgi:hypothetical protein